MALTMSSMILVAVLGIYSRAQRSAASIRGRLDEGQLLREVLQRMAEDVDRIITPGQDTKISVLNKVQNGYPSAQMVIEKAVHGAEGETVPFERIVWQGSFDPESEKDGLVIYRGHSGLISEDRILGKSKESWERELFVPICDGVTYFSMEVPDGNDLLAEWAGDKLPNGIVVTVSLGIPFKTVAGTLDVADEDKITRTIAVDRSRKIPFNLMQLEYDANSIDTNDVDANSIDPNSIKGDEPRSPRNER